MGCRIGGDSGPGRNGRRSGGTIPARPRRLPSTRGNCGAAFQPAVTINSVLGGSSSATCSMEDVHQARDAQGVRGRGENADGINRGIDVCSEGLELWFKATLQVCDGTVLYVGRKLARYSQRITTECIIRSGPLTGCGICTIYYSPSNI